ncbi:MAG: VWA domain-containing protein [Candidatus Solibacter usitatus]|nr:VWA domain-containing protein [Candidatus Solibacter usitatus]
MRRWIALAACLLPAQDAPSIRVDVHVVNVACTVRDRDGALINDLGQGDFEIRENGAPQTVRYFARRLDQPLTVGLLLDYSGSQRRFIERHRADAVRFLRQVLHQGDHAVVVGFTGRLRLLFDLSGAVDPLEETLARASSDFPAFPLFGPRDRRFGGTAFRDAVFHAARIKLKPEPGRKALLILTDGMDNASRHKLSDAIEAAQSADAIVYCISYQPSRLLPSRPGVAARKAMNRLAGDTGGRVFDAAREEMPRIFQQIEEELRSTYELGYVSNSPRKDGKFRKIEVLVKRPGLKVRARKGYYPAD